MTKLVIVRHAEAEGNQKGLFQGHTDADVSEKGHVQLDLLAIRCRNMERSVIYSSPLKRALLTAQAINQFRPVPIQIEPDLIEINGGVWENIPWKDLPKRFPEESHHWTVEPWAFAPPLGEPMTQVYDRVYNAVQRMAKKHKGETVFVVTHGCVIRNLICRLKYNDIKKLNEVYWCDNTALSVVEIDENGHWHLTVDGDNSHLDKETSTIAHQVWWLPGGKKRVSSR